MALSKEEKLHRSEERKRKKWEMTHLIIEGKDNKLCGICKKYKLSTEGNFYKNKSNGIDGLNPYCIPCTIEKSMNRIYENYEEFKQYLREYDKQAWVREQKTERGRKYRNSETYHNWVLSNSERLAGHRSFRVLHKSHEISDSEWLVCKEYFNNECAYCGLHISEHFVKRKDKYIKTDFHKEHADHCGSNKIDNCVPSCLYCNSSKHAKELLDWYNENNKHYKPERLIKIHKWLAEDYKICFDF